MERQNELKMTPDDLIIVDYLIQREGNEAEIEAWNKIRKTLKRLAHKR